MGRDTSPCIVGDYWLDKRRDGLSPDIWQIASYAPKSRSVVYRSTKRREVEDAKPIIHAFVTKELSRKPQQPDDAKVLPHLILYYEEHGKDTRNSGQSASSMRAWIGFFMQDELGPDVTFAQVNTQIGERFQKWRMGAHSYSVPWCGKVYDHASAGIKGESVQRNIEDFRAALNHAVSKSRVPYAPKVGSVKTGLRSRPRDVRLTLHQLGAVVGFVQSPTLLSDGSEIAPDAGMVRWLLLMIGTACRPDAALAFNPELQDKGAVVDIHPPAWPRTKKVNPIVPLIASLRPVLDDWKASPHKAARTRRSAFRTARRAIGLDESIVPKTIRHTIATELRARGVPGAEVSGILGHPVPGMSRTSAVYAHYDPAYLGKARKALTKIFAEVMAHADQWRADHLRTKKGNGPVVVVDKPARKAQISAA
jgi:integrase